MWRKGREGPSPGKAGLVVITALVTWKGWDYLGQGEGAQEKDTRERGRNPILSSVWVI